MSPTKPADSKKSTARPSGESAAPKPPKPPLTDYLKLVGIGMVAGMILFLILLAIGAHPTEIDLLGIKFALPSSVTVPSPTQQTTSNPADVLYLENLPFWAFSYGFGTDFIAPQHFSDLITVNDIHSNKTYKLSYSMPLQGDAAAGISFTLAEPVDVTGYSFIQVSVKFADTQCDLFLKDSTLTAGPFVTLSDTAAASLQAPLVNGKWQFKIPLTNFDTINKHTIKEIGCNAQRCEGQCIIEVGEIDFSKQ